MVLVSVLLPLVAPVFGLIALAVRVTSRGPVFFRQTRVGQNGRLVTVLKFRSLHVNDSSDTTWSVANDDRHTIVGKFLRKSSLDELPQLINVLKGDMSLVGPRPERPYFVSRFDDEIPNYRDRHRVPVGMTGWAQIHGLRGDTSLEERVRFDNDYIENWSLAGDLKIILLTESGERRSFHALRYGGPPLAGRQSRGRGAQDRGMRCLVTGATGFVGRLLAAGLPCVLGHADFEAQNLRWQDGEVWAVHDWDSLAWQPEAALVGAASGSFASSGPPTLAPIESSSCCRLKPLRVGSCAFLFWASDRGEPPHVHVERERHDEANGALDLPSRLLAAGADQVARAVEAVPRDGVDRAPRQLLRAGPRRRH